MSMVGLSGSPRSRGGSGSEQVNTCVRCMQMILWGVKRRNGTLQQGDGRRLDSTARSGKAWGLTSELVPARGGAGRVIIAGKGFPGEGAASAGKLRHRTTQKLLKVKNSQRV